ncbi:uncharacterized protein PHALS_03115 [Plasmopara halstedii]|uniref:Uncharacterized protein n=1 Tax=Plasmopara halstedii TaxID=4781 RepID=A0A0P1A8M9_PLAHL|nr:uncharacterized protein PHALS_03115 [Plasmopara halstedii]CEG36567.1 hypothetical protein PHALS_03115 [Plasmopara halstedii]|eukprot:XP_024572936.1 hypothetical protein PHALS_03115 [Plasmopara halstedii]
MSCSLIEAKFQLLDRAIEMLSISMNRISPRIASSEELRKLVAAQKLASPKKPIQDGAKTTSDRVYSCIENNKNQREKNIFEKKAKNCQSKPRDLNGRRDRSQGSNNLKWIDLNQKDSKKPSTRKDFDFVEMGERIKRLSHEVPRSNLLDQDRKYGQGLSLLEKRISNQKNDDDRNDSVSFRATSHSARPPAKRSIGYHFRKNETFLATRCRSAAMCTPSTHQSENYFIPTASRFATTEFTSQRENHHQRPRTATGESSDHDHKTTTARTVPLRPDHVIIPGESISQSQSNFGSRVHDPTFYMLELRLIHPSCLTNWRFQASFTNVSMIPYQTVFLDDLMTDDENCLLFNSMQPGSALSRRFNPFMYFPGLNQPSDLYGHVMNIVVTSLHPVTCIVINTTVQFTRYRDEAVVEPSIKLNREHLEAEKTPNAKVLIVQSKRSSSAPLLSSRRIKVSCSHTRKIPRPPCQNKTFEASTDGTEAQQYTSWVVSQPNELSTIAEPTALDKVTTLRLVESRPPSPTTIASNTKEATWSLQKPLGTIDSKKMQLQRLRANIRKEMSKHVSL